MRCACPPRPLPTVVAQRVRSSLGRPYRLHGHVHRGAYSRVGFARPLQRCGIRSANLDPKLALAAAGMAWQFCKYRQLEGILLKPGAAITSPCV